MKTIPLLQEKDAQAAKCSAELVVDVHRKLTDYLRSGITLPEIDTFVANAKTWSTKLENTTKEHPLDTPDAKGSLKPNRFKV